MKTLLSLFAVGAVLLTGCAAAQATPEPASTSIVSTTDHLKPTGTAVPCDPAECDPDEGEEISAEELAELKAWEATQTAEPAPVLPAASKPSDFIFTEESDDWNCYEDGNRICGPDTEGLATEAWDRFDVSEFPAETLAQAFKVTYHGTAPAGGDLPPSEFHTVASSKAGFVHVFSVELSK
jgi:hypothetical protein